MTIATRPDKQDESATLFITSGGTLSLGVVDEQELLEELLRRELRRDREEWSEGFRAARAYMGWEIGSESWINSALSAWTSAPSHRRFLIEQRGIS